jgi:hypothetical protein
MTTFTYKTHRVELKPVQGTVLIKIDGEFKIVRGAYSQCQAVQVACKIIDAQLEVA